MKCLKLKCHNERYSIVGKGGMCPTWEMALALERKLCLVCAKKEVDRLRNERKKELEKEE